MISKKICMLGAFSVGKTSLVARYVHSIFTDKYLSTVGVKISKKAVAIDGQEITLVLWDMEGKDDFVEISIMHLRGAMGFFVVADGTRAETLDTALSLRTLALEHLGDVPFHLLVNKADLIENWEVKPERLEMLRSEGVAVFTTSAKTGQGIEDAFSSLAGAMMRV